jgi:DNA-binding MarR family transcriptional regulator
MFDHCIYFNTSALARRLEHEWAEAFAPFELSPPQGFMLRAVLARPGLLQKELSDELSIAKSTATRALDFLVAKGYVERRAGTADAREKCISPTRKALAIRTSLNAASAVVDARLKKLLGQNDFADTVSRIKVARATLG